jgi:hypothetical protein
MSLEVTSPSPTLCSPALRCWCLCCGVGWCHSGDVCMNGRGADCVDLPHRNFTKTRAARWSGLILEGTPAELRKRMSFVNDQFKSGPLELPNEGKARPRSKTIVSNLFPRVLILSKSLVSITQVIPAANLVVHPNSSACPNFGLKVFKLNFSSLKKAHVRKLCHGLPIN